MKFWKNPELEASLEYVRLLTKHFSKSFYFSARLLPVERRWATFALYGFCRYADNLIDNPRNRSVDDLLSELDGFSKELNLAYRHGESEHPIIKPFILVAREYQIPADYPFDLLKGVKMDIERARYQSFQDLYVFCYRVAGVVGLMMTHTMGYRNDAAFFHAEKLGVAMQLTNILRDVKEDKEMGRIYLPQEELRQYGLTETDIFEENFSDQMKMFIKFQVDRAHHYYREAEQGIPMLETASRFAIASASRIYEGILDKIEQRDCNPFLGRAYVPFRRKMTILMQEVLYTRMQVIKERLLPENV